ncbi:MAG: hypothetical protein ACLUKN_09200 [Bacilli bacterium]
MGKIVQLELNQLRRACRERNVDRRGRIGHEFLNFKRLGRKYGARPLKRR